MSAPRSAEATVAAEHGGMRADRYLSEVLGLFPRSQIPHRGVRLSVDGSAAKPSRRLRTGERLRVEYDEPERPALVAEEVPLSILFENDDVVVIDKPAGVVVHPGAGNWSGTLAQGLMHHVGSLAGSFGDRVRPGIVHRLDKETSGVLIAAKHPRALEELAAQFRRRTTRKSYLAIVKAAPRRSSGTVATRVARDPRHRKRFAVVAEGGREAVTEYRVLKRYAGYSFVLLRPTTGRTHQLRVHMAHLGCPIAGDAVYGRPDRALGVAGLMLHAWRLEIVLPGETAARRFTARTPDRFRAALRAAADPPSERSVSPPRRSRGDPGTAG